MEKLILSWTGLIAVVIILLGIYIASLLLRYVAGRTPFLRKLEGRLIKPLRSFSIIYEPIIILIIGLIITLINPILHGIIIVVLLAISYPTVRNYIDGRVFLLNSKITKGQHIMLGQTDHIIQHISRLGMRLVSDKGTKFIYFSQLTHTDYLLPKGATTGSFHQLQIQAQTDTTNTTPLADKLLDCPYLDWTFQPEIRSDFSKKGTYTLKILMNKDQHLDYLVQWVTENGFHCESVAHISDQ